MKFKNRLYVGFGLVILVMTILLIFIIDILSEQNHEMNNLVEDKYDKIKVINKLMQDIETIDRDLTYFVAEKESTSTNALMYIQTIRETMNNNGSDVEKLDNKLKEPKPKEQLNILKEQLNSYYTTVDQIISLKITGETKKSNQLFKKSEDQLNYSLATLNKLVFLQEDIMDNSLIEAKNNFNKGLKFGVLAIFIGILLGTGMAISITNSLSGRLKRVKTVMQAVENRKEKLPRIHITAKDEIGEIALVYNKMATALETHEQNEKILKKEMSEQNWLKTKVAKIGVSSQAFIDLSNLGQHYLENIAETIQAHYGLLFIKGEENGEYIFRRIASFAVSENNNSIGDKQAFKLGEGLIGQCGLDNKTKKLNHTPCDYIKISSGLGCTNQANIIIHPIEVDGEVKAVIELASYTPFTNLHEQFLEQALEQLGIILHRIEKQMQINSLLEESQSLNEELQLQQEELKTINEELQAQYKSSEEKSYDLEKAKLALEEKTRQVLLSSQYQSEFFANMSHELRTPLNSLLILAEMLLENKEGNLNEKQKEFVSTILSSGKELLELINDILDLSKLESGKMEITESVVSINHLLSFIKKQFTPIAKQKQVEFIVNFDDGIDDIIHTDEQKVYQIIKNLLSNAFKFTEIGQVQLKVTTLSSPTHSLDSYVCFEVSDTGIGISPDKLSLIFEAFRQADGTTSRKYGGTGLGLSISKDLAQLLGGSIKVDSVEGSGSTFNLLLPIKQRVTSKQNIDNEIAVTLDQNPLFQHSNTNKIEMQSESEETEIGKPENIEGNEMLVGKKVMVVDDDMRNIFALTSVLEEEGMKVVFSENGYDAIELLKSNHDIDIVLMDIMMPKMDGFKTMTKIRTMEGYEDLPIISITAKAMKNDRQKCIDAGASDYISKPIQINQLISLLKVWLYRS